MKKLNWNLLTDEERMTPMGMGYLAAAERLGLVYLANVPAIWKILTEGCDKVRFHHYDLKIGKISQEQFWQGIGQWADELAVIMRGENPSHMAIPWFTEPNQLRQHVLDYFDESYADMPDSPERVRWLTNPIREFCFSFLSNVADVEAWNGDEQARLAEHYSELRFTLTVLLGVPDEHVHEQLGILFNKS